MKRNVAFIIGLLMVNVMQVESNSFSFSDQEKNQEIIKKKVVKEKERKSPLDQHLFVIHSVLKSSQDFVLDIAGESKNDGAALQIYPRHGLHNQVFKFVDAGEGYVYIYHMDTDKVLDCGGKLERDGSNQAAYMIQKTFNGKDEQKWQIQGNLTVATIMCKANNKVLDVKWAKTESGNKIWAYPPNNSGAQKFRLEEYKSKWNQKSYVILSSIKASDEFALDIKDSSKNDGAALQVSQRLGLHNQVFKFVDDGEGYAYIYHLDTDKVLDCSEKPVKDGPNQAVYIKQKTFSGSNYQKWLIEGQLSSVTIKCKANNKVLDVKYSKAIRGNPIWAYPSNNSAAQKFILQEYISKWNQRSYTLHSRLKTGKTDYVVDIRGSKAIDGAIVQIYTNDGGKDYQKFTFVDDGQGYAYIYHKNSNVVLDCSDPVVNDGSNGKVAYIKEKTFTGSNYQKWMLQGDLSNGYLQCKAHSDKLFAIRTVNGKVRKRYQIFVKSPTYGLAQRFRFEQV